MILSGCTTRLMHLTFKVSKRITEFLGEETLMEEKSLIKLWNQLRLQIIQAQVAPALVLIAIVALAAIGSFETANDGAKYLALGVAAVTGILATISQYAAVREGEALIIDLRKIEKPSALTEKIADSRGLVSLSAITIIAFDIAIFALVVWAVLGA
jgi:hypothetical protein